MISFIHMGPRVDDCCGKFSYCIIPSYMRRDYNPTRDLYWMPSLVCEACDEVFAHA